MSDLLSYIYRKLEKENKNSAINLDFSKEEKFDDKFRSYIYEKLEDYYKGRNKNIEEITDQIEEIFQPSKRQLLTIFDLNPTKQDSDLDEAILKAFSKSYSKPKKAELSIFIEGKLEDKYLLNTGNQAQNFEIFQELANEKIVLSPNGILLGEEKDELLVIEAFKKKKNLIILDTKLKNKLKKLLMRKIFDFSKKNFTIPVNPRIVRLDREEQILPDY
ncbi:hypothetical protein BpHYR1_042596 [Brachionus plicatilis]|uniref:Uncharacterized protein n=1 Tax=Brachionus plicatilis TaxID=10195 RepID=A0A3M7QKF2_BRAPC|nr:hypothetical protein BpHYR1_042596 [Brachionus plicatilis]